MYNLQKSRIISVIAVMLIVAGFIGCSKKKASYTNNPSSSKMQQQTASKSEEKPVAPEKNPIGDIPDNQAFVKYTSLQGGYEFVVPEGWARTTNGMNVTFIDKLDGIAVTIISSSKAPRADFVRANQAEKLKKTERAVEIKSIKNVKLASGPAVLMVYESNSEPDPITNKKVRLENNTYFYYENGKLAGLRLWAPVGADNVDQWERISNSFRWR